MRAVIRRHLTYANVMATIAVFLALAGTTIAAGYVVTRSGQIKDGAVTGSDVKNSSLSTADIRDDSLHGDDIQDGSLTARDFAGAVRGEQGLQGVEGPRGPKGDQGPRGVPGGLVTSLPSGDTLQGVYAVDSGAGSADQDAVTFQVPLASKPQARFVAAGTAPPQPCEGGSVADPRADPGFLCVFERYQSNRGYTLVTDESGQNGQAGTFGFVFFASTDQPNTGMNSSGSWAVTAP